MKNLIPKRCTILITRMFFMGLCVGAVGGLLAASSPDSFNMRWALLYTAGFFFLAAVSRVTRDSLWVGMLAIGIHWSATIILEVVRVVSLSMSVQAVALGVYGAVFLGTNLLLCFVDPSPPMFQKIKDKFFRKGV